MRHATRFRPSPAFVIAILALVAAVAGTAVAGPVANKGVSKGKAKKIADKEIDKKAPGLSVSHAGTADSATSANNANTVNNVKVSPINVSLSSGGNVSAFNGSGLNIQIACTGAQLSAVATTTKQDSSIYTSLVDTDGNNNNLNADLESGTFDTGVNFDLLATGDANPGLIHFEYDALDGSSVSGIFSVDEDGTPACRASGHVESS